MVYSDRFNDIRNNNIFFMKKIGFHITQGKIVALIGLFLSWSMILIRGSVVKGIHWQILLPEAGRNCWR